MNSADSCTSRAGRFVQQAERAVSDFRRGQPVLLRDAGGPWLAAPVEQATAATFDVLLAGARGPLRLVLTAHRLTYLGVTQPEPAAALTLTADDSIQTAVHLAVDPDVRWPGNHRLI